MQTDKFCIFWTLKYLNLGQVNRYFQVYVYNLEKKHIILIGY